MSILIQNKQLVDCNAALTVTLGRTGSRGICPEVGQATGRQCLEFVIPRPQNVIPRLDRGIQEKCKDLIGLDPAVKPREDNKVGPWEDNNSFTKLFLYICISFIVSSATLFATSMDETDELVNTPLTLLDTLAPYEDTPMPGSPQHSMPNPNPFIPLNALKSDFLGNAVLSFDMDLLSLPKAQAAPPLKLPGASKPKPRPEQKFTCATSYDTYEFAALAPIEETSPQVVVKEEEPVKQRNPKRSREQIAVSGSSSSVGEVPKTRTVERPVKRPQIKKLREDAPWSDYHKQELTKLVDKLKDADLAAAEFVKNFDTDHSLARIERIATFIMENEYDYFRPAKQEIILQYVPVDSPSASSSSSSRSSSRPPALPASISEPKEPKVKKLMKEKSTPKQYSSTRWTNRQRDKMNKLVEKYEYIDDAIAEFEDDFGASFDHESIVELAYRVQSDNETNRLICEQFNTNPNITATEIFQSEVLGPRWTIPKIENQMDKIRKRGLLVIKPSSSSSSSSSSSRSSSADPPDESPVLTESTLLDSGIYIWGTKEEDIIIKLQEENPNITLSGILEAGLLSYNVDMKRLRNKVHKMVEAGMLNPVSLIKYISWTKEETEKIIQAFNDDPNTTATTLFESGEYGKNRTLTSISEKIRRMRVKGLLHEKSPQEQSASPELTESKISKEGVYQWGTIEENIIISLQKENPDITLQGILDSELLSEDVDMKRLRNKVYKMITTGMLNSVSERKMVRWTKEETTKIIQAFEEDPETTAATLFKSRVFGKNRTVPSIYEKIKKMRAKGLLLEKSQDEQSASPSPSSSSSGHVVKEQPRKVHSWTSEEEEKLIQLFEENPSITVREIYEKKMINPALSYNQIANKRGKLQRKSLTSIPNPRESWTLEEIVILENELKINPNITSREILNKEVLGPHRTYSQICHKLSRIRVLVVIPENPPINSSAAPSEKTDELNQRQPNE